ncbi:MAG: EI24 domain-containing protein [Deltaproteobacteria bacterium]|nr:EI24 domain-containing protein [Deltaproteobacteria bacterium]
MIHSFATGFSYLFKGARFLFKQKSLWKVALLPIVINIAFLVLCFFSLWPWVLQFISRQPTFISTWEFMNYIVSATAWILTLILAFLLTLFFGSLIASPFNDWLSEKTEKIATGSVISFTFSWKDFIKNMTFILVEEFRKISLIIVIQVGLILLHLLPLMGSTLYFILNPLVTIIFIAFEYVDYSMGRRHLSLSQKCRWIQSHFSLCLGFGCATFVLFFIPLINFTIIPVAVVGATLLYVEKEHGSRF